MTKEAIHWFYLVCIFTHTGKPGMWLFPVTSLLGGWCVGLLIGGVHLLCQTMWSQRPHKVLGPHGGHGGCHADQVG